MFVCLLLLKIVFFLNKKLFIYKKLSIFKLKLFNSFILILIVASSCVFVSLI